jgi:hypothetical protein
LPREREKSIDQTLRAAQGMVDTKKQQLEVPPRMKYRREQVFEIFHERYRPTLVRWFKITDTLPDAWDLYDVPKNCWFVQFSLNNDDTIAQPRLVAVSKRTGEIVYDDSEVRQKRIS